jgi:hypothetical protein
VSPSLSAFRWLRLGCTAAASLALVACASKPSPDPALAAGAASVDAARAANAGDLAATDMNNARSKLERARALAQAGQRIEAIRLAEQADADAQVARAKAGAERTRLALDEVDKGLRTLREELARGSAGANPSTNPPTTPSGTGRTQP